MLRRQNAEYCKVSVSCHEENVVCHFHKPPSSKFYDFEIAYVLRGKGYHITKNGRTPISSGSCIFVDYGVSHGYEIPEGERLELINVVFDRRAIGLSPNKYSLATFSKLYSLLPPLADESPREDISVTDGTGRVCELFLSIRDEFKRREPGYHGVIKGRLLEIVILGMRRYFGTKTVAAHVSPAVSELKDYLTDHYMEDTSLSELARKMHFSLPYLSKKFKEETGKTYTDTLHEIRINESCRMLADPDVPIETVAEYLGYSDSKKYRTKFKQIVGMSPREYRKNLLR